MTAMNQGVVLVSMPWGPPHEPSLGLGVLKACLQHHAIDCTVIHAAPELLRWVTVETYQFLSDCWGLNEFIFTGELDNSAMDDKQSHALAERLQLSAATQRHPHYKDTGSVRRVVQAMRSEIVPAFVREITLRILNANPVYVGFTCMFDQTMASLAVAKCLKQVRPDLPVVLGGYALQGPVAANIQRAFPFVDAIVLGDGEEEVVRLYQHYANPARVRKALPANGNGRAKARTPAPALEPKIIHAPTFNLAQSPAPDFSDWFATLATLAREHKIELTTRVLPIEASRGCWWGQVSHCSFCGIDDESMKYRYKSADRVLEMLHQLREQHGDVMFRFSDYIMPKAYYTELLPRLAQEPQRFRLQSEIKANHPPERVALLAAAGYRELQPGIESFSTSVLKAMRKGVRAIDNVSLLKAGYVNGIVIDYNILYGLPSDTVEDYDHMLSQVPMLYHLMPPISRNGTMITRFAPLQTAPGKFGLTAKQVHHPCYDVLFSSRFLDTSGFVLDDYGYYFARNFEYTPQLHEKYRQLTFQVECWKSQLRERFVELSITLPESGEGAWITDTRFSESGEAYPLNAVETAMYQSFDDAPQNIERIRSHWLEQGLCSEAEYDQTFANLLEHRLLWLEDKLALGLAVPGPRAQGMRDSGWSKHWMSLYT